MNKQIRKIREMIVSQLIEIFELKNRHYAVQNPARTFSIHFWSQ